MASCSYEILIIIIYEVIILIAVALVVKLFRIVYRLCNFSNLQMHDKYVEQKCCPNKVLGNENNVFLEISSITNVLQEYILEFQWATLHNSQ